VELLSASLADAQAAFAALASATDDAAADLAVAVVQALAADPAALGLRLDTPDHAQDDGTGSGPRTTPLLPGPAPESREDAIDWGDALTRATTAARDAGAIGTSLLGVLRDPIAGDLGSWERDPAGLLAAAIDLARSLRSVEEGEDAVATLEGEALRSLCWAAFAVLSNDPDVMRAAGERGAVHVGLMLDAVAALEPTA